jgi:hypothetical protein
LKFQVARGVLVNCSGENTKLGKYEKARSAFAVLSKKKYSRAFVKNMSTLTLQQLMSRAEMKKTSSGPVIDLPVSEKLGTETPHDEDSIDKPSAEEVAAASVPKKRGGRKAGAGGGGGGRTRVIKNPVSPYRQDLTPVKEYARLLFLPWERKDQAHGMKLLFPGVPTSKGEPLSLENVWFFEETKKSESGGEDVSVIEEFVMVDNKVKRLPIKQLGVIFDYHTEGVAEPNRVTHHVVCTSKTPKFHEEDGEESEKAEEVSWSIEMELPYIPDRLLEDKRRKRESKAKSLAKKNTETTGEKANTKDDNADSVVHNDNNDDDSDDDDDFGNATTGKVDPAAEYAKKHAQIKETQSLASSPPEPAPSMAVPDEGDDDDDDDDHDEVVAQHQQQPSVTKTKSTFKVEKAKPKPASRKRKAAPTLAPSATKDNGAADRRSKVAVLLNEMGQRYVKRLEDTGVPVHDPLVDIESESDLRANKEVFTAFKKLLAPIMFHYGPAGFNAREMPAPIPVPEPVKKEDWDLDDF